ncbi:MAG: hypothetical protein V5B40_02345 [Candidatus Accumulibacter meliphilus]
MLSQRSFRLIRAADFSIRRGRRLASLAAPAAGESMRVALGLGALIHG